MEIQRVVIVQDRDSGFFIASTDGDIGLQPLLRDALRFQDVETAIESAFLICDLGGFLISEFYEVV